MKQTIWTPAFIAKSALIAAIYVAATGLLSGMGFGQVQIRIAEALYVLALYTLSAVPGLTVGCLLSNLFWSPFGILDITLGTLATFLGALGVAIFAKKNRVLALCMPVITNALLVPIVLSIFAEQAYWLGVIYVGVGQAIACVGLGYPLAKALDKVKFLNEGM